MAIDLTQSEIPKWNDTIKSDHYTLYIFNWFSLTVLHLSKWPQIYYRFFVFYPNGNRLFNLKISNKTNFDSDSNSVGLFYDTGGEFKAHLLQVDLSAFTNHQNFFVLIFLPILKTPFGLENRPNSHCRQKSIFHALKNKEKWRGEGHLLSHPIYVTYRTNLRNRINKMWNE